MRASLRVGFEEYCDELVRLAGFSHIRPSLRFQAKPID